MGYDLAACDPSVEHRRGHWRLLEKIDDSFRNDRRQDAPHGFGVIRLPERPLPVAAAAGLLLGSAGVLACTWVLGVDAVESNGARVFFMVVWSYLAWTVYGGGGWARWALAAVFVVTVWGFVNAPSWQSALADVTAGEAAAKALALCAFGLLLHPAARAWFAHVHALLTGVDSDEAAAPSR